MSTHLILTVGTGTAGRHSNLAEGLKSAVRITAPDSFSLVPSTDEVSRELIAEEVRTAFPEKFRPWSEGHPYRCVDNADDLESARVAVREAIVSARLAGAKRILVNPTSGTKQMTAGGTLAALDAGIAELSFIVGERENGVVITGTERITTWSADRWLAEQALGEAKLLYAAGAYPQASRILRRFATTHAEIIGRRLALCEMADAWGSLDFTAAAVHAGRFGDKRREAAFNDLAAEVRKEVPASSVVAEAMAVADHHYRRQDHELAVIGYYRAFEIALRWRVWVLTDKKKEGVSECIRDLDALDDPLGIASRSNQKLHTALWMRNELTHGLRRMEPAKVAGMGDVIRDLLKNKMPPPPSPVGIPGWPD